MKYTVSLTRAAEADLVRLTEFLAEQSATTARRAGETLKSALRSLQDMPLRTPRRENGLHEMSIRFGESGYVIQYRVDPHAVVIARIFHTRERRSSD